MRGAILFGTTPFVRGLHSFEDKQMFDEPKTQREATESRATGILQGVLVLGLLILIGWQVVRDLPSLRGLSTVRPLDLAASAVMTAAALCCFALSSVAMVAALNFYRREHRLFYFRIWMQAYVFRYFPGKIVLVYQRMTLGSRAGIPASASVVFVGWETILQMLGAALVCVACLGGSVVGPENVTLWLGFSVVVVVAMLGAFPVALSLGGRWPRLKRFVGDLERLRLSRRAQLGLSLGYSVAWVGLASSFFFFCRAFVPLGAADYPRVVFWFVASYVAGVAAAIAPAGIGVREGLLALGLSHMLPSAQAAALAVGGRLWMTVVELLCVGSACLIPAPTERTAELLPSTSSGLNDA